MTSIQFPGRFERTRESAALQRLIECRQVRRDPRSAAGQATVRIRDYSVVIIGVNHQAKQVSILATFTGCNAGPNRVHTSCHRIPSVTLSLLACNRSARNSPV